MKKEILSEIDVLWRDQRFIDIFILVAYGVIVSFAMYQITRFSLNHDVGQFLLEVRGLSEGRPYADANMPSNIWLPYISFLIADHIPFYFADIHQSVILAFAILCVALIFLLLQPHDNTSLVRFAAILGLPSILLLLPGYHFGQREHLFALSSAPLLVLLYNRRTGIFVSLPLSILVACVAAFGASQKPYFILSLMALGTIDLVSKKFKSLVWEFLLIGLFLAAYFVWINAVYPTYFLGMLPGAFKTLGSMRLPLVATIALALVVPLLSVQLFFLNMVMFGLGLHFDTQKTKIILRMFYYFIVVATLSWIGAVIQRFCFDYHFLPFKLFVACTSVIIFAWLIENLVNHANTHDFFFHEKNVGIFARISVVAYIAIILSQLNEPSRLQLYRREVLADPFTKLLQTIPRRTPILMLSSRVTPISPIHAYADIRWTGTFLNLLSALPISHALAHADEKNLPLIEAAKFLRQGVTESFKDPSPQFVFVDVSKVFTSFAGYDHPNIIEFLSGSADFQRLWVGYQKVGHLDTIYGQELDVYKKK